MKFGPVPVSQAQGAILAHSLHLDGTPYRKGLWLTEAHVASFISAGLSEVTVARLEPDDIEENTAAQMLADALNPDENQSCIARNSAFTGRVNLNALCAGVAEIDVEKVQALNRIDPAITLATLAPYTRVSPRSLVGTVKIISYAVSRQAIEKACVLAAGAVRVRPVQARSADLILTEVAGQKQSLTAKGEEAIAARLSALGISLSSVRICAHSTAAIAHEINGMSADIHLILTGSATSDLHDVGPEAVRRAGGSIARFGMPVDPGNLLFLGELRGKPVIGLPGCARSPALNGADWVLERIACGVAVSDDDIAGMGVGGLLKEIPIRPQPREPMRSKP